MNTRNLVLFTAVIAALLLPASLLNHREGKRTSLHHQSARLCTPVTPTQPGSVLFVDGSGPVPPPPIKQTSLSFMDGSGPVPPPPTQHGTLLLADGSGPVPPPPTQAQLRLAVFPV